VSKYQVRQFGAVYEVGLYNTNDIWLTESQWPGDFDAAVRRCDTLNLETPEPRRIVQIAATSMTGMGDNLYAICDDGTAWCGYQEMAVDAFVWHRLPPLPSVDEMP